MTKIQHYLAQNIKKYRKEKNLTQEQLATLAGTSTNYIGTIEIGKRFPSPAMIERLAAALNVDSSLLFQSDRYSVHLAKEQASFSECKSKLKQTILIQLNNAIENIFSEEP
ncbi:MAG: helix-turn-helix transcriptional regulator [Treponema sp.]|nr:helix-turn-helix transcriptional regulator [Treponema sp.]